MNICVFGAVSSTIDAAYLRDGRKLGSELARREMLSGRPANCAKLRD